jgi:ABC-type transport system involved in multi-copper enzyme maturation permease subunit
LIAQFAWHELRQQLGGRVFWIVFTVSVLMVTGAMAIDELRVGLDQDGPRGGASAIVRTHLVWSLFFLFTAAAVVGEAVLRDESSGFGELIRATPVSGSRYALGRFAGAFGAVVLCFVSVPLALALGGAALGLERSPAGSYLFAFCALALPNLLLACALFFTLAGVTRSMNGCLLGAAGLLTVYGLAGERGSLAVLEPFGFAALAATTQGWSLGQRDASWPALSGLLLANRVLWLSVAAVLVGLRTFLACRDERRAGRRRSSIVRAAEGAAASWDTTFKRSIARRQPTWRIVAVQLLMRTSFEARRAVVTPTFMVLLMMGLAAAVAAVSRVEGTSASVAALATSFQLVPVVVVLFFAGELFWAEREHNFAPILMATPVHNAVLVLAKLLALALLLLLLALASASAGAVAEGVQGGSPAPASYVTWYILPRVYDWLLLGALALFLQSLAPNKLAGWGYMVFYLIGSLALNRLGLQEPHYRYGSYPGMPLPPALSGAQDVGWYRLGWGLVAVAMVVVACKRGLPKASVANSRRNA